MPDSSARSQPDDTFQVHVDPDDLLRRQLAAESDPPVPPAAARPRRTGRGPAPEDSGRVRDRSATARPTRSYAFRRH